MPIFRLTSYASPRLARAARQLQHLPRAIGLVWTAARRWTIAWAVLLALQGLLPVATVYLTRPLVNSILEVLHAHASPRPAIVYAALIAGVLVATEGLRALSSWIGAAQSELVQNHVANMVCEKSAAVDLGFYDTPEFFDHLHRARAEAATVPLALTENLGGLVQNGITLIAMAGVLTTFGIWLPFALLLSTLPALYVVLGHAARQYAWSLARTSDQRRAQYYEYVLTSRDFAPELRLLGLAPHFGGLFRDLRLSLTEDRVALARGQSAAEFGAGLAALAISALSLLWMGARVFRGQASAGDLALFYQAFQQGLGLARILLGNFGQIYRNSLYLEGLFEFLDMQPLLPRPAKALPLPARHAISMRNVTFHYPGSQRVALQDFSMDIPARKMVAIVGENGAGKSTLIKLLCRFYDPDSGRIEIDGRDLRDISPEELRNSIGVLFQEPAQYQATVAENISPGASPDAAKFREAARLAGADVIAAKLPLEYDHPLGRWIVDGAELSAGEWQRVALARAFLRDSPILILDEPTSAMDPWAEADWLERFRQLARGRTSILITHRFSTARIADRIVVMAGGRIVESGTHEELLAQGGRYAGAWEAQVER